MNTGAKKLVAIAGFAYGAALSFYAVAWGVDGPTLTMPLAASPLNVPAAIVDSAPFQSVSFLTPVLIIAPIVAAPFCWAAVAVLVTFAQHMPRRLSLASVLIAHYGGIGLWFLIVGSDYLLRPFRILRSTGALLLAFYAAGQMLIWWALLRRRSNELTSRAR